MKNQEAKSLSRDILNDIIIKKIWEPEHTKWNVINMCVYISQIICLSVKYIHKITLHYQFLTFPL